MLSVFNGAKRHKRKSFRCTRVVPADPGGGHIGLGFSQYKKQLDQKSLSMAWSLAGERPPHSMNLEQQRFRIILERELQKIKFKKNKVYCRFIHVVVDAMEHNGLRRLCHLLMVLAPSINCLDHFDILEIAYKNVKRAKIQVEERPARVCRSQRTDSF
jgi:hypothetical protein